MTNRGRPTVLTDRLVRKLEDCLKCGMSVSDACFTSGISRDTFYRRFNEDSDFSDKMTWARNYTTLQAKQNISKAIAEGDLKLSIWLLNRNTDKLLDVREEVPQRLEEDEMAELEKTIDDLVKYEVEKRLLEISLTNRQLIA